MSSRKQWFLIIQIWFGMAVVLGGWQWWRSHADPRYNASKCERRIRSSADPVVLQLWAIYLLRQYHPDITNYTGPFTLPPGLQHAWSQPPSVALIESSPAHEAHVRVRWGGGMLGHWGLRLGSTNLVAVGNCELWRPGVYFWREFAP